MVIPGGLAFTRHMYLAAASVRRRLVSRRVSSSRVVFSVVPAVLEEFRIWRDLVSSPVPYAWASSAHRILVLRTDASNYRWGGHLFASAPTIAPNHEVWDAVVSSSSRDLQTGGPFSADYLESAGVSINVREAAACRMALESFSPVLNRCFLDVYASPQLVSSFLAPSRRDWLNIGVDNQGLFFALSKGASRSPGLNAELKAIFDLARRQGLRLVFHHIPGLDNTQADLLSRED
ncbi:hypothetical protein HDU67_003602, partial [Dinochytrium kinnereticum]